MWAPKWAGQRPTIRVKSDSISARILALDLKTTGKANTLIAREIALDIAQDIYKPNVVEHIAGLSNVTADSLSRIYQPDASESIPLALSTVERTDIDMDSSLFRTLHIEATL